MNKQSSRFFAAAVLAGALAFVPAVASAESQTQEAGNDFGVGMVTVLANVVYMPVKVVYGVMGGVTGGFAYVLSGANRDIADGVWVPSLGGDYVLTTDMMTGRERVHFSGVRDGSRAEEQDGLASVDDGSGGSF